MGVSGGRRWPGVIVGLGSRVRVVVGSGVVEGGVGSRAGGGSWVRVGSGVWAEVGLGVELRVVLGIGVGMGLGLRV